MTTINSPVEKTYFGCVRTTFPNLSMVLSNTLLVTTAFELGSQCFRFIKDGNNVELNIQAQRIPALMVNPYPTNGSKGDVVMAENAATVVMLVKKMGIRSESIVDATAFFVSLNALNSLKNFVIT